MSFTETVISLLGGGVIGYLIKHYLDLRLMKQSEAMSKKREVYEEIAIALGVFVSRRTATINDKERFLEHSAKLWLWASDPVIQASNKFISIMIKFNSSNLEEQKKAKHAYANFVIEMRKDLGFPKTALKSDEYMFVSFKN